MIRCAVRPPLAAVAAALLLCGPALAQETSPVFPDRAWPLDRPAAEERRAREGREGGGGEIETDRDSFTPAVTAAGRGRLIAESAYSFIDNPRLKETHSYPELLLRYGLTERLELRLGWNYEVGGAANEVSGSGSGEEFLPATGARSGLKRESNLSYGLKYALNDQRGWLPASAAILQATTPTSGPANDSALTATYVVGWELPQRWKLDAAMRYRLGSEGADWFNVWSPSVVLKVPLAERINVHAEYFGLFSQNKEKDFVLHYFSPGVHYLVTDNLEVGFRVGWGLNDQSARFFVNAGVGVRF